MTPEEHALKIAALKVLSDLVSEQYNEARKEAEKEFAPARRRGVKQLAPTLPDGTELGTVSIKAGIMTVQWDESALLVWVMEHAAPEAVERITKAGTTDPELLDWARINRPGLMEYVVRDVYRKALGERLVVHEPDGFLLDPDTAETTKVATVTTHKPSGAFAFKPTPGAADAVADAWRTGQLSMDGTVQPLPAGDEDS